jgi:signal transduction histidine kinase
MTAVPETDFYAAFLHELSQPVTAVRNLLELTTYRESNDWPAVVEDALENVERIVALIDLMSELKRLERTPAAPEQVDLASLVREAIEDLGIAAAENGKPLQGEGLAAPAWVWTPPAVLRPALFRILDDAIHHTPSRERINIVLRYDSGTARLDITSAGMRFSPAERETLLALAQTGRGPRGAVTRRVFRVALILRTLALHGAKFTLSAGQAPTATLQIALPVK